MMRTAWILAMLVAVPGLTFAQQAPPKGCIGPEHRHFDYWAGDWNVFNLQGAQVGTSRITSIAGGCGLLEEWQPANNPGGRSLNFYDSADRQWHQVWIGADGNALRIAGGLQNGAMTLTGADRKTPQGTVRDRITWTPQPDGAVEQRWDLSSDGGNTWQTSFVGIYRRKQ